MAQWVALVRPDHRTLRSRTPLFLSTATRARAARASRERRVACQSCDDGKACTADKCNADGTCGHDSLTGTACATGVCVGDVCHCGSSGEPCCATGQACESGQTCQDGHCGTCGAIGQTCCALTTPCAAGGTCNGSNVCRRRRALRHGAPGRARPSMAPPYSVASPVAAQRRVARWGRTAALASRHISPPSRTRRPS